MIKKISFIICVVVGVVIFQASVYALPSTYGFENISENSVIDAAIGESQLFVDVEAEGTNQISFKFKNIGSEASSITDVYLDRAFASLLDFSRVAINDSGYRVRFDRGASPSNLPSGGGFSAAFSADSRTINKGVNPGEWVEFIFDLQSPASFADIIAGMDSGALMAGIYVKGFADGENESFVTTPPDGPPPPPPAVIPEPATVLLVGVGLLELAGIAKKRS